MELLLDLFEDQHLDRQDILGIRRDLNRGTVLDVGRDLVRLDDRLEMIDQALPSERDEVDGTGIRPLPKHIEAVQDFAQPADIKALQRFLGMINFYNFSRMFEDIIIFFYLIRYN